VRKASSQLLDARPVEQKPQQDKPNKDLSLPLKSETANCKNKSDSNKEKKHLVAKEKNVMT
jgi:hypothetical protein